MSNRWCWRCRKAHGAQCPMRDKEREAQRDPATLKRLMRGKPRRCAQCGRRKQLRADHVVPLSQGGTTQAHNMQWLCAICHAIKTRNERKAL